MIENNIAKTLEDLDARTQDLYNAYTPGYRPSDSGLSLGGASKSRISTKQTDVAAPADSYFIGNDPFGRRFYSRDGTLGFKDGTLTTRNGYPVLGFAADDANHERGLVPLSIPEADRAAAKNMRIEADGSVAYDRPAASTITEVATKTTKSVDALKNGITPDDDKKPKMEKVVIGRMALARFPAGTPITAADGVHLTVASSVKVSIAAPGEGGNEKLLAGRTDRGSVDVMAGTSAVRDLYLKLEAMQSAGNAHGKTDKAVMDLVK